MADGRGTAETRFLDPAALLPNNATAWSYIVMAKGKLVGLISIGDIVKSIIADQQFIIVQLVRYVSG
jgi:hypothetical protein